MLSRSFCLQTQAALAAMLCACSSSGGMTPLSDGSVDGPPPDGSVDGPPTVNPELPPAPATVAPPLDRSVATSVLAASTFLYTGDHPIQTGVDPATIDGRRVAVLRGE
jgi:hypothetical protein